MNTVNQEAMRYARQRRMLQKWERGAPTRGRAGGRRERPTDCGRRVSEEAGHRQEQGLQERHLWNDGGLAKRPRQLQQSEGQTEEERRRIREVA